MSRADVVLAPADYTIMNKTLLDHTNVYTSSEYASPSILSHRCITDSFLPFRRRVVATAEIFTTYVHFSRLLFTI
jgi:hypothetical protein